MSVKEARICTSDWQCKAEDRYKLCTIVKESVIVAEERRTEEATDRELGERPKHWEAQNSCVKAVVKTVTQG